MSTVTVWAQDSEADIVRVKLGQDVYFTVLGQSKRWDGKVRQISPPRSSSTTWCSTTCCSIFRIRSVN